MATPAHTLIYYLLSLKKNVFHKYVASTSDRAVINDITLLNSSTHRDKLLREF